MERSQKTISFSWYTKNLFVNYWVLRAKHGFIFILDEDRCDEDKNPTFSVKQILNIIIII